jgi:hypothetical protein
MVLIGLFKQSLQDGCYRAGFPAAGVAENGDVAAEKVVDTNLYAIIFEHYGLANPKVPKPGCARRSAGNFAVPDTRYSVGLGIENPVKLVVERVKSIRVE